MGDDAVVIGLGEMGGIFAHGMLRCGRTVHPVTRAIDPDELAREVSEPAIALVAVAEGDLDPVLARVPEPWRDRVALLQNELLPADWKPHAIVDPTIAIVWFEKKREKPLHVVLPTLVLGPRADVLLSALDALAIPAKRIDESELLFELVRKNLYILTANIAGLEVGGTVAQLWRDHRDLAADVASEIVALQAFRAGEALPHERLVAAMVEAFDSDPEHACTGRSAPGRLRRALALAEDAGISMPTLARIAERHL